MGGMLNSALDPFKKAALDLKKAVELDEGKRRWRETTDGVNFEEEDEEEDEDNVMLSVARRRRTSMAAPGPEGGDDTSRGRYSSVPGAEDP